MRRSSWDHPRRRGEQGSPPLLVRLSLGPSPRARGAVGVRGGVRVHVGTIPAGAGSRGPCGDRRQLHREHPRGRGEQTAGDLDRSHGLGPSPRARGAGHLARRQRDPAGTIPAGAGSSCTSGRSGPGSWDHPRVHGEQLALYARRRQSRGASPRARGAATCRAQTGRPSRTIPAGAGSRAWRVPSARTARDHPRGRGSSGRCVAYARMCRDHPRGRGEQSRCRWRPRRFRGPSPRARGAEAARCPRRRVLGTIPACTGSRPTARCPAR